MAERINGKVAVIGAGMAGLSAARQLQDAGVSVVVLDKGRYPGGRISSRRYHDRQFDYGAPYLRPHSRRAAVLFSTWRKAGIITPWRAHALELPQRKKVDTTSWHVAVPSQGALARHLGEGIEIHFKFKALDISGEPGRWSVISHRNQTAGPFETVFVTCAAEQAGRLLKPFPEFASRAEQADSRPCLATMVEFEEEVMLDYDAAFLSGGSLSWVCRDSSKPERDDSKECWVLHGTDEWSAAHLRDAPEKVASLMLQAFALLSPAELPPVGFCRAHRWRYAFCTATQDSTFGYDSATGIGIAGDWCNTPNVDGAYWSGYDLAEAYLKKQAPAT